MIQEEAWGWRFRRRSGQAAPERARQGPRHGDHLLVGSRGFGAGVLLKASVNPGEGKLRGMTFNL